MSVVFRCKGLCIAIASICILIPTLLNAQLTLEGEFRPRTEFRNGYRQLRTPATEPAFFTSQRMRLSLNYSSDPYEIHIEGQDVRVWGEVVQLQDNPNVNIHEAWAKLNVSDNVRLKLGRQELIYGNQRLLGSVNWTQQARSHDALVAKYENQKQNFSLDIGVAYNQQSENLLGNTYQLNNYKILSYAWLDKQFGALDLSALFLTDGFELQRDATNFRYTYGTNLTYNNELWKISGVAYFQNGDDRIRRDISAYMLAISGSYSWNGLSLEGGYDYLSGGEASNTNPARHSFNTLYATNHKFYGQMDYFLSIPGDTRGGGLQDIYIGVGYSLNSSADLNLTYHYFALANKISNPLNPMQRLDQNLGSEFDLSFAYQFSEDITLRSGYSMLLPTSSLDKLQLSNGKETQHWGWVMLQVTPDIFSSE